MRVTQSLHRQHIGWYFHNHWQVQGKRTPMKTEAEAALRKKGVQIEDANEFLKEKFVYERVNIVGIKDRPQPLDNTHPNWQDRTLLTYKDNNVLLEGLTQAKILTNTVEIKKGLPEKYHLSEISKEFNRRVKKIILGAHVFDAEQKKLPIQKDPERPAWNFPRSYGITQERAFKLLLSKLLNLIETTSKLETVQQRYLADNVYFSYPFEKNGDLIQFQLLGDSVLLSNKCLSPITNESTKEFDLPDLFPIKPTITLNEENIYVLENMYSINKKASKFHPHTLFINFNKETVKNLFEEEVTEQQINGRTLLKTFTAAASYARAQFGENVKNLPTPVTLQAIQTDGQTFYFGVLQLNTLDVESSETRNIWFQTPGLRLFDECSYQVGKPVLGGYNKEVIRHLVTFYNRD